MPGMKKWFIVILWALLASSCGPTGKEISSTPSAPPGPLGGSFAVLPVADYSYIQDVEQAHRQQATMRSSLLEALAARGFDLSAQPRTYGTLVRSGQIKKMTYEQDIKGAVDITSLQSLLNEEWSDMMKSEIVHLVKTETRRNVPGLAAQDAHLESPRTAMLDREAVVALGREWGVDFILRTRALRYDLRQEYKVEPLRRQTLPFFEETNGLRQFGVARADHYDPLDNLVVGGTLTELGRKDEQGLRVQLWVHDAATGEVLWTGRAVVDSMDRNQEESTIGRTMDQLIGDFTAALAVDSDGDGVRDYRDACPGTPSGAVTDASGCPRKPAPPSVSGPADDCPSGMLSRGGDCLPAWKSEELPVVEIAASDRNQKEWSRLLAEQETLSIELLIQFDFDQARIKPIYHSHLEEVARFLRHHSETRATIEGHTDSVGSETYNLNLSLRRAESVKTYLVEQFGIEPSRLKAVGHGKSRPVGDNETPQGRNQNRRSVAVITAHR